MAQRPMTSSGRDDDPPARSRTVFPGLGKFIFTDVSRHYETSESGLSVPE